ncbi:hypothetical protein C0992_002310, partial [Termitomyces sp. T32_za158]
TFNIFPGLAGRVFGTESNPWLWRRWPRWARLHLAVHYRRSRESYWCFDGTKLALQHVFGKPQGA